LKPSELIDLGDRLVLLADGRMRAQASGVPLAEAFALVSTIEDGKFVHHQEYYDHAEALEAATAQAMSEENVEIVRRFYRAWAGHEFPGPIELMDPEIDYINPAGAVEPGTRRGRTAFGAAVEKVFEGWGTWEMEPEQFTAVGDRVAVVVRYRARGRASGVEVEGRESALWTLRDGNPSRPMSLSSARA
jgi:uncharacterized protein